MKRDMELVRTILLRFEDSDKIRSSSDILEGLGEQAIIQGHLQLLADAGFIEQQEFQPIPGGITVRTGWRITWAGHEFLSTVRDPEIWRQTKDGATKLGSWSIKLLAEMASGYVRTKAAEMGLPLA